MTAQNAATQNLTVKPVSVTVETPAGTPPPRPGSRAARMTQPLVRSVLKELAEQAGVCLHPVVLRRTDTQTGQTEIVEVPCGATLASKCAPCAERGRRLRMQQIREGWHLAEEPTVPADPPAEEQVALVELRAHLEFARADSERSGDWADMAAGRGDRMGGEGHRGVRAAGHHRAGRPSAQAAACPLDQAPRRHARPAPADRGGAHPRPGVRGPGRLDAPPVDAGHADPGLVRAGAFRGTSRTYRVPCACGRTHQDHDSELHTPVDPAAYDYRAAALDAIFFAPLIDRFWKNVRAAAGWKTQCAGAVGLQKRLAPHAHFAMRGTLPRKFLKELAVATYKTVWWPAFDRPVYSVEKSPVWDEAAGGYIDPTTRALLPTWDEAVDALEDDDAEPAYVARLGKLDARGIEGGTKDAERSIRYVTKYVTKDLKEHASPDSDAQSVHFERLHTELSVLPCSASCANWLLYGLQPKPPVEAQTDRWNHLVPGRCKGKVHQPKTLGFTGRRVLISRQWSDQTLADHRADNRDLDYLGELLPRVAATNWDLRLHFETKSNLRPEQVALFAAARVRNLQPGIESLSSAVLKLMDKGVAGAVNVRVLRDCEDNGITVAWNYLYGFPGETAEDCTGIIEQIPALCHLQPPSGACQIVLNRFSPYFDRPELGLADRAPAEVYQHVYQLPEDELADLVYAFDSPPAGITDAPTEKVLLAAIDQWQDCYGESCLLLHDDADGGLLLDDRRALWPHRTHRLTGWHADAYRILTHDRTGDALRRTLTEHGHTVGSAELSDWLSTLLTQGLIIHDDHRYVALATRTAPVKLSTGYMSHGSEAG